MKRALVYAATVVALALAPASGSAQWSNSTETDEMTGQSQHFAMSDRVSARSPMTFPYTDVEGWLGYGCTEFGEWVYFGFTEAPNITRTEIGDGFERISTRVRWGQTVSSVSLDQEFGSHFVHFVDDRPAINGILSTESVLLELAWFGQERSYFEFSLQGAPEAVANARALCGVDPEELERIADQMARADEPQRRRNVTAPATVRREPTAASDSIGHYTPGRVVRVIECEGGWCRIRMGIRDGYIRQGSIGSR